jgi:hypothetical protein
MLAETSPELERMELEGIIERQIAQRTWGRVRQLRVDVTPDRIVVHGYTSSYYVKQMALEGVLDVLRSGNAMPVELDVEVGTLAKR